MSYEDYAYMKHSPEEADTVDGYVSSQQAILKEASVALAVGPLLFARLKEMRGQDPPSIMIVPGLSDRPLTMPTAVRLHAIAFGRFDPTESLVKQIELSVAAFARAVRAGFDSKNSVLENSDLRIVGANKEVTANLRQLAEHEAGRVINLIAHDFVEERDRLAGWLHNCNLCLMLSWHEGFGLSAWEAIGAGVPVVLTKNSGVFKLLEAIGGPAVGCVFSVDVSGRGDGKANEKDIEETKRSILAAVSDISKALANARSLRAHLRLKLKYTWDKTATDLARALGLPITVTMLDASETINAKILEEPADVVEGSEVAAAHRVLSYVEAYYMTGNYSQALNALESVKQQPNTYKNASIALDATILEAEVRQKLNQYPQARLLLERAAQEALERKDWDRYIRAKSVENVILRDQNQYAEAVQLARSLYKEAYERELAPISLEKVERLFSRSLAFIDMKDEALEHAGVAIKLAQARQDSGAEANGQFTLGEAYRHGGEQLQAVESYKTARDMAGRVGDTDCFLWSVLCLADSLFLLKDYPSALGFIQRLEKYVNHPAHTHPLESLHIQLSAEAVRCVQGQQNSDALKNLVDKYKQLGITWPATYVSALLEGQYNTPKRF